MNEAMQWLQAAMNEDRISGESKFMVNRDADGPALLSVVKALVAVVEAQGKEIELLKAVR